MREAVTILARDKHARCVSVQVPEGSCFAEIDADYFRQVFLNLLLNAAQAMDGNGQIRIEIADDSDKWHLRVIDHGPGIREEIRGRLFEPFFTTEGHGTGLGLALVKQVIDRHGGEVSIDCDATGTTVSLRVPHRHHSIAAA
jgi:two-component system sensor histidine kinase AtoS